MDINLVKTNPGSTLESRSNIAKLMYVVNFAAEKHKNQRRKNPDKTPYVNHPIGVANILIEEGEIEDLDWISAAILHDTVEDTDTTIEELEQHFGSNVASIVKELTDDVLPQIERKKLRIINAPNKSIGAKTVGMCDKIYNLRDLDRSLPLGWTEERRIKYFIWSKNVVEHYYHANLKLSLILKNIFDEHKILMDELVETTTTTANHDSV